MSRTTDRAVRYFSRTDLQLREDVPRAHLAAHMHLPDDVRVLASLDTLPLIGGKISRSK